MMMDMRRLPWWNLIAVVAIPLGLASLWASYGPGRATDFVPWLAVGWACVACGLLARRITPWSLEGELLMAVGFAWLLPDLSSCLNVEPISHSCVALNASPALAAAASWLWLAVLGYAIVAFPDGRATRPQLVVAVVATYALAVAIGIRSDPARLLIALLLIATPVTGPVTRRDLDVPAWAASTMAGVALAMSVLLDPGLGHALEAGVFVASLSLLAGLATIARRRGLLTADRAVELGDELADALGDPTFRISVRTPDDQDWLMMPGMALPADVGDGAASTSIMRGGVEIARLAHDESTLADTDVRAAVIKAVELEAHNARLRADLEAQAEAIASSRRRLVDAGLREREALGRQVKVDVTLRLDGLVRAIEAIQTDGLPTEASDRLRRAAGAISFATAEVEDLARGLYPPALAEGGLVGAVQELVATSPIDVRMETNDSVTGGPDVDATLYFLCAEALTNAVRHGRASSVEIEVVRGDAGLIVRIRDDGVGGADLNKGTGLRGLRDRVEALGGRLELESRPRQGTRIVASIPVYHDARQAAEDSPSAGHSTFAHSPPQ